MSYITEVVGLHCPYYKENGIVIKHTLHSAVMRKSNMEHEGMEWSRAGAGERGGVRKQWNYFYLCVPYVGKCMFISLHLEFIFKC